MTDCPYCKSAHKIGDLYCSLQGGDVESLDNGIFTISNKYLEEPDWHFTRLSFNINLSQPQIYRTPQRKFTITPDRYLLLNNATLFKTSFNSDHYQNRRLSPR